MSSIHEVQEEQDRHSAGSYGHTHPPTHHLSDTSFRSFAPKSQHYSDIQKSNEQSHVKKYAKQMEEEFNIFKS